MFQGKLLHYSMYSQGELSKLYLANPFAEDNTTLTRQFFKCPEKMYFKALKR